MLQIRKACSIDNCFAKSLVSRSLSTFGIEADFDGLDFAIGSFGTETSLNSIELVAENDGCFAGCLAIQPISHDSAKLFGFHIEFAHRGKGIGRALLLAAISESKRLGYRELRLDTWKSMQAAIRIYESLGFQREADPLLESGADRSYSIIL